MNFEELQIKVLEWADDKDLLHHKNCEKQFMKFIEEVFEFKCEMDLDHFVYGQVMNDNTKIEMGDIFVTLIILCEQIGIDSVECLSMAYEKIKDRKGKTLHGTFIKEEDLEDE